MKFELTQRFYFEAAHSLRREVDAAPSRRIHGHTYIAEVTVAGAPDATTGMVVDLSHLRRAIDSVRHRLDHRFLDDVDGLGLPTLENLCLYIWQALTDIRWELDHVVVKREASGDSCCLRGLRDSLQTRASRHDLLTPSGTHTHTEVLGVAEDLEVFQEMTR